MASHFRLGHVRPPQAVKTPQWSFPLFQNAEKRHRWLAILSCKALSFVMSWSEPLPNKKHRTNDPRSYNKCMQCRSRKVKCLPVNRDWERGERCNKCIEKGDSCGPNAYPKVSVAAQTPSSMEPFYIPPYTDDSGLSSMDALLGVKSSHSPQPKPPNLSVPIDTRLTSDQSGVWGSVSLYGGKPADTPTSLAAHVQQR